MEVLIFTLTLSLFLDKAEASLKQTETLLQECTRGDHVDNSTSLECLREMKTMSKDISQQLSGLVQYRKCFSTLQDKWYLKCFQLITNFTLFWFLFVLFFNNFFFYGFKCWMQMYLVLWDCITSKYIWFKEIIGHYIFVGRRSWNMNAVYLMMQIMLKTHN